MGWIQYCCTTVRHSKMHHPAAQGIHAEEYSRTASIMGYPTIGCLFNETIDLMLSDKDPFGMPRSFKVLLECQRFYNRASNSFATCIEECRGVPSHLVDNVEQEFRIIQNLLAGETSGSFSD